MADALATLEQSLTGKQQTLFAAVKDKLDSVTGDKRKLAQQVKTMQDELFQLVDSKAHVITPILANTTKVTIAYGVGYIDELLSEYNASTVFGMKALPLAGFGIGIANELLVKNPDLHAMLGAVADGTVLPFAGEMGRLKRKQHKAAMTSKK